MHAVMCIHTLFSYRHTGLVTCVGMDEGGLHCISGSQDSTAIVWEITANQDLCSLKIIQVKITVGIQTNKVLIMNCSICL